MDPRLAPLASRLQACRRRGNRLTLECVLESAKILSKAREIARRDFGAWLRDKAHMDRITAHRYLRVLAFVRSNVSLTQQMSMLSLAKIYALSSIDPRRALRILKGKERFSAMLEHLSDLEFRREFRARFPRPVVRFNRENLFRHVLSLLNQTRQAVEDARRWGESLTTSQRRQIASKAGEIARVVAGWRTTVA